jgi:hypothetical protein
VATPSLKQFRKGVVTEGHPYDQEIYNGRAILDGGKTWEVNWIAVNTRVKEGN